MKLVLLTVVVVALALAFATCAMAGDYHTGSTLKCYECHVTHGTESHAYGDDPQGNLIAGGSVTASAHMLKQSDIAALCLSCHDGGEAVDVYGAAKQGGQPVHRSGGSFNNDVSGPYAPFASTYGHDLKSGAKTPPGGSVAFDLDCVTCHEPHGNDYYRNLKDLGNGGITYSKTTNDTGKDVFESKPYPSATVVDAYDASSISYNLPASGESHVEGFCVSCHTNIHSDGLVGGNWLKHPTVGHSRSYTTGTVSPLKTLGGLPVAGGTGALVAGQVSCITCHKAHGSPHPFGLIYDNRTTTDIEDSGPSENVSVTCKHCHDKGLTATE